MSGDAWKKIRLHAMQQAETQREPAETPRAVAVACIVLARYLASRDPAFQAYLKASLSDAETVGLAPEDLRLLRMLLTSVSSREEPGKGG